jgi:hypothetical protein
MAYQNGTATNPTDLLQKLATFIAANGWSQDMSQADGTGWRLHAHRSGVYVNIRAMINSSAATEYFTDQYSRSAGGAAWSLYCGDGFSSGSDWKSQSGGPKNAATPANTVGVGLQLPQGAITGYHFFADETGDNIVVVVEKSVGIFVYCGWGISLKKMGTWTGGAYFFANESGYELGYDFAGAYPGRVQTSGTPCAAGGWYTAAHPATYVRADVDSFTGKWISIGTSTTGTQGYTGKTGTSCTPIKRNVLNIAAPSYIEYAKRLTSKMTGQSLLLPSRLLVTRDTGGNSFLGAVPNVFVCNACQKGYTPATVYPWGTDNYMVFPGNPSYPEFGFAIRKV